MSRVIFTLTVLHSATHMDALDLYGFMPDVPAMMRRPLPTRRDFVVTRDELAATLPDQFPDAYYVSLAFVVQVNKPDEVTCLLYRRFTNNHFPRTRRFQLPTYLATVGSAAATNTTRLTYLLHVVRDEFLLGSERWKQRRASARFAI